MPSRHNELRAGTKEHLQKDSDYMALVQGRVYPKSMAELTSESDGVDVTTIKFPATTFRVVGSSANLYIVFPQLIVQHWSEKDYSEAWEVADAFYNAIHRIRVVKGNVAFVWDGINAGQEVFDPDRQLPYVVQQFRGFLAG